MAQATLHHGDPLMVDYTAGGAISAGDVIVTADTVRIAHSDMASGELGSLAAGGGVYQVAGDAAIAADKLVYWNDSANKVTETASSNKVFGYTVSACTGDAALCYVRHNPSPVVAGSATGTEGSTFEIDTDSSTPKIALASQTGGTGDYTTTLKPESTLSADNAIIVPEADGDTLVAVALTQTLTGKTLGGLTKVSHTLTPVAAAGSTVSDAAALNSTIINHITSDSAAKGVKLPTTAQGHWGFVVNNSSTAAEFYAAAGGTVNGLSADASVVIPASKGLFWFATAANTVIAFDMPAKATAS